MFMNELGLKVLFSRAVPERIQLFVQSELEVDGITYASSNNQLVYLSTGTPIENIIVEFTGFITVAFASGFAGKAGADVWGVLKERFRQIRERHRGGLELHLLEAEGTSEVRYVIPADGAEAPIAIESIESDLENLTVIGERERWWLGPPVSRWGTGLECVEYRNRQSR
jgi:hypothetical protein